MPTDITSSSSWLPVPFLRRVPQLLPILTVSDRLSSHFRHDDISFCTEVARTRLRQEGDKYHKFVQTIALVWKEEGKAGLYRGLGTQLVRQIPNTAIMMATYELIVYLLKSFDANHHTL